MINNRMKEIFRQLDIPASLEKMRLQPALQAVANSSVANIKSCWLLSSLLPEDFNVGLALDKYVDMTELECTLNKVHIEDFLPTSLQEQDAALLTQGILFAYALFFNLQQHGYFKVILGFESPNFTELSGFSCCTVRFHAIRYEEESWLSSDLDRYQDAVLILESFSYRSDAEMSFLQSHF